MTSSGPATASAPTPVDLAAEADRLLDGARQSVAGPGGFWWLDDAGRPDTGRPRPLWITARMTHCFSLGVLLGRSGDAAFADHGVAALTGPFADQLAGGWHAGLGGSSAAAVEGKGAYDHAFVLLAASSAVLAGRPGADAVLERAVAVVERRFWDEDAGAVVDQWDRGFTSLAAYRGANANMHSVEAFLAVADATADGVWRARALRIADRLVNREARVHDWRVAEHFDDRWRVLPEYNADAPDDPFRPYGVTPGHGLEWARLLLQLDASLPEDNGSPPGPFPSPDWLVPAAVCLFDRAVADGWDDRSGGLVYTTDWAGVPVVRQRFHWVVCEGIAAAAALHRATGQERFAVWYARLWDEARSVFLDPSRPGWLHEADPDGAPSARTWSGRPDVYHAVQATLVPRLPLAPGLARALRSGLLDRGTPPTAREPSVEGDLPP